MAASLLALGILIGGCGLLHNSSSGRLEYGDFFNMNLPLVREAPHPDSGSVETGPSYRDMKLEWSVAHYRRFGRQNYGPSNFRTFATLWSRDLAQRALEYETGVSDLSPELQDRLREDEMDRYARSVTFEVHMFVEQGPASGVSDTDLRGAGATVRLEIDEGTNYRPLSVEAGYVETFETSPGRPNVYYRTNRVTFPRIVNGHDILQDASLIRLIVRQTTGRNEELWFSWRIRQ